MADSLVEEAKFHDAPVRLRELGAKGAIRVRDAAVDVRSEGGKLRDGSRHGRSSTITRETAKTR